MKFLNNLFSSKNVTEEECVEMIEKFLEERGLDPKHNTNKTKEYISWNVSKGSASIYIYINIADPEFKTIRVVSPIISLPDENILPLYRRCLELNMDLCGAALAVFEDTIVVISERPIEGLDSSELDWILDHLAYVADELDDQFADEFGAKLIGDA